MPELLKDSKIVWASNFARRWHGEKVGGRKLIESLGDRTDRKMRADPILEGLVTTLDASGAVHLAPMGPRVSPDGRSLLFRPFPTSQTFRNLQARGEGVFHVTDDVLLLARAAMGAPVETPRRPADRVRGFVLLDACRYQEFVVRGIDESRERVHVETEVVHAGFLRDFWGFNRGKHAVLEAAILMTRLHLAPIDAVVSEFDKLAVIVDKTGGPVEWEAFMFLRGQLDRAMAERNRR